MHGYTKPWPAGGGSNIWDEEWELGYYDASGAPQSSNQNIRCKNYIPVSAGATYYMVRPSGVNIYICQYDENKQFVGSRSDGAGTTFTARSDAKYIRFNLASGYGTTYGNDVAINYPATVTTYSPYANICPITGRAGITVYKGSAVGVVDVYSVEFTTAPDGVVYGGYVDLAKGTLTATKVLRKINYCDGVFGATNYGYAVYVTLSNRTANTDTTSNMFQKSTQTYTAAPLYSYPTSSGANTTWTFILPSTVTSKAEANAWLTALDPPLVVTENLATPVTYEIPKEKIKTMLGLNNFWTDDANDTIAVSYWEH